MSKYVEILFRHRLRFLILLVVLPAELVVACVFLYPHQTGTSSLWVDTPAYINISPAVSGWDQFLTPAQNTVDALDQLRSTDSFLSSMGANLDASNTFKSASERSSVLSTMTTDMVVAPNGSHLVVLTYTCPHEPICTNVLTASVQVYRKWLEDQQTAQANIAITFYTGQVADAQAKLQSDQTALANYINAHPNLKQADAPLVPEFSQLITQVNNDVQDVAGLQQKLSDTKLTNAAVNQTDDTVLKVVDQPRIVGGQISSLPKKQMAIAGIASLALALIVLVAMVWSDRTTREPRELESHLKIPVVVTIPDLALMAGADG